MKAVFYPDLHKNNAFDCAVRVCEILIQSGIDMYFDNKFADTFANINGLNFCDFDLQLNEFDVVIAAGGDGTIMRCAKKLAGTDILMLGINTGRLGFLASIEQNELELLSKLSSGEYGVNEHMMLTVSICNEITVKSSFVALNEVVVSRASAHMCDMKVCVDDSLLSEVRADGVMLSTPTGSTAYALSAGGPLIEPHLECIEFITICPHSLFARPMLLAPSRNIKILPDYSRYDKIELSCDGNKGVALEHGDFVTVKMSDKKIKFVEIKKNTFFDSVNEKLIKPLKSTGN